MELGVVIGQRASGLTQAQAMDAVAGYALCLDMTAWDLQCAAKEGRKPWGVSKGFDTACPVSGFIPKEKIGDVGDVRLWLKGNTQKVRVARLNAIYMSILYFIFDFPSLSYVTSSCQYFRTYRSARSQGEWALPSKSRDKMF